MEEYQQLNWSRRVQRSFADYERQYSHDFAKDNRDIWNLHLNEINPAFLDCDSEPEEIVGPLVDPRTNKVSNCLEIDCTKNSLKRQVELFRNFSYNSSLSKKDHILGVRAIKLGGKASSPEEQEILDKFEALSKTVQEERMKFNEFERSYFEKVENEELEFNESVIDLGSRNENGLNCIGLGDHYQIQTAFLLNPTDGLEPAKIEFLETKLSLGIAPRIKFETTKSMSQKLVVNTDRARALLNPDTEIDVKYNEFLQVLKNENGGPLLEIESVPLFIDGENVEKEWIIPLNIEESGFMRFNYPIFKESLSCKIDSFSQGMKKCLLTQIIHSDKLVYSFDDQSFIKLSTEKADNSAEKEDNDNLVMDIDESSETTDEMPQKAYKLETFEDFLQNHNKFLTSKQSIPSNRIVKKYKLTSTNNFKEINVGSKCDGVTRTHLCKDELVFMSLKMEYKPQFGAQKMTYSELIKEWVYLQFSEAKQVCRVRVDMKTNLIMSIVTKDLNSIEKELKLYYNKTPEDLMGNLLKKFEIIQNFPAGKYILKHEANGNQVKVYCKTDEPSLTSKTISDLIKSDSIKITTKHFLDKVYSIPIDENELTQLHKIVSVIPACCPFNNQLIKPKFENDRSKIVMNWNNHKRKQEERANSRRKIRKNLKRKFKKKEKGQMELSNNNAEINK